MESTQKNSVTLTWQDAVKWLNTGLLALVSFFLVALFNDIQDMRDKQIDLLQEMSRFTAMTHSSEKRIDRLEERMDVLHLEFDKYLAKGR